MGIWLIDAYVTNATQSLVKKCKVFIFVQYYAADAYSIGVANIDIYSADTDVLILSLDHFDSLPEDTIFVRGNKQRKSKIPLVVIRKSLFDLKTRA